MQDIMQLVRLHPESVAFVFKQYGHPNLPLNHQSVKAMFVKYGEPFAEDLANHVAGESEVSNYTGWALNSYAAQALQGLPPTKEYLAAQPKKKFGEKLKEGVLKLFGIVKESGVIPMLQQGQQQQQQYVQLQQKNKTNTALLIGAAVVVLLLVGIVLFSNKKTVK